MKIPKHSSNKGGFSLIELMVSLTIFAIVMLVGIGTLLIVIDANAKAQALSSSMSNLSFALDNITRSIRAGRNFYCTDGTGLTTTNLIATYPSTNVNDCTGNNNNTAIIFTPRANPTYRVAYKLLDNVIYQLVDKPSSSDSWIPITSDEPPVAVTIDTLKFILENSEHSPSDYKQPILSLIIKGTVQNGLSTPSVFQIQSQVVQRLLDII